MGINTNKADLLYNDSIRILKQVQIKNGGCIASLKHHKYPYIYPRDCSLILMGFISAGLLDRSKKGLQFLFKIQNNDGSFSHRYDMQGKDASYKPKQIDGNGLVLIALGKYFEKTNDIHFVNKNKDKIISNLNFVKSNINKDYNLIYVVNSINEFPPFEEGLEIWTNSVICGGLQYLNKINKAIKIDSEIDEFYEKLRKSILKYFWHRNLRSFIKTIRLGVSSSVVTMPDPSIISLTDFNLTNDNSPKIVSSVKRIEKELWNKDLGGVCRYPKYIGRNNSGWGPWPLYTLMICRHFIRRKNKDKADQYLSWVIENSYNGEIPEHISTKKEFEEFISEYRNAKIMRPDRERGLSDVKKHPMYKKRLVYAVSPLPWAHAEYIRTWNLYRRVFLR